MAEGWTRQLAGDRFDVRSAGIEAHGQNEHAIKAMADVGIDISEQQSIRVNGEMLEWADLLVTLCDNAEEQCPVINPYTLKLHLPLADPAKIKGTPEEIEEVFAETRELIHKRVQHVLKQLEQVA
jgi:arsenate reductase